jgi:hypothetical protein
MPEVKNSIARRLYGLLANNKHFRRGDMRLPVTVSLLDSKTKAVSKKSPPAMRGYLGNISKTELSLVMSSVHFGDPYLMCSGYIFQITVEFPNRAINIQATPVRYNRFEESQGEYRYLLTAHILQMTKSDRRYLYQYIKSGGVVLEAMNSIVRPLYDVLVNRVRLRRNGMRLPLAVSLLDSKMKAVSAQYPPAMSGYLHDISRTGLSLIMPSLRLGDRYPIGSSYTLRIMVKLPNRVINIQATPVRYERLEEGKSEYSYLVGVRILQMTKSDRRHLIRHIQQMKKGQEPASGTSLAHDTNSF